MTPRLPFDVVREIYEFIDGKPWKHIYKNQVTKKDLENDGSMGKFAIDIIQKGSDNFYTYSKDNKACIRLTSETRVGDISCDLLFKIEGTVENDSSKIKSFYIDSNLSGRKPKTITDRSEFLFKNDPDGKHFWAGSTLTSYPIPMICVQMTSLFVGVEFENSSTKNKVVGYKQTIVYLNKVEKFNLACHGCVFGPKRNFISISGYTMKIDEYTPAFVLENLTTKIFPTIYGRQKITKYK